MDISLPTFRWQRQQGATNAAESERSGAAAVVVARLAGGLFNRGACADTTVRKVIAPTCRNRRALLVLPIEHATSSTGAPLSVWILPRNRADPMPPCIGQRYRSLHRSGRGVRAGSSSLLAREPWSPSMYGLFFCALTGCVLLSAFCCNDYSVVLSTNFSCRSTFAKIGV